jgi:hypothetical protein
VITRLRITPPTLSVTGVNHVGIRFKLSQRAHVSICVLNSKADLVRERPRGSLPAGWAHARYYGYNQRHRLLPAGCYEVMVRASNATGTATARRGLALTGGAGAAGNTGSVRQCTLQHHA